MRPARIALPLLLALASLAVAPSAGAATTWYASPNGSGLNTCTDPQHPCDSITATSTKATSGDTVVFAGDQGTYQTSGTPTSTVLHVKDGVTVMGAPGQSMPVWYSASSGEAVTMDKTTAKLVDFDIEYSGTPGTALGGRGTVDRVIAHATGSGDWACTLDTGPVLTVTITNSICRSDSGTAFAEFVGGGPWNITLRNDLIYGAGDAGDRATTGQPRRTARRTPTAARPGGASRRPPPRPSPGATPSANCWRRARSGS